MAPKTIPIKARGDIAYHYGIDRGQFFSNYQYKKVIWVIWSKLWQK